MNTMLSAAVGLAAAGALLVASAPDAEATLMVEFSDGVNPTLTFADNVGSDIDSRLGILATNASIGDFSLVFTVALSKPFAGSADDPVLDLTFTVTSLTSGGGLTIKITDTDFVREGPAAVKCGIGGISGGTVGHSCFYDNGNTAFGTTSLIGSLGPFGAGAFSGVQGASIGPIAPYSLTNVLTIAHSKGLRITTGNAKVSIPEPGTLGLFGFGLLGLGFLWRRRFQR